MTTYQQYLGQIVINDTNDDFTVDDGGGSEAVEITSGTYYISGYTGESTDQLCDVLQTKIRALGGVYAAATVTYSSSTGLATIDFATGGTNITVLWDDTALQTLLGFAGTQTGAESYTATYPPLCVWRPSLGLAEYPGDLATWWLPTSSSMVTVGPDGTITTIEGNTTNDGIFEYRNLPEADIKDTSLTVNTTLQSFWENVVHKGRQIRCYPDRTLNTVSDFKTAVWLPTDAEPGEPVTAGPFSAHIGRSIGSYNGLWNVSFKLAEMV